MHVPCMIPAYSMHSIGVFHVCTMHGTNIFHAYSMHSTGVFHACTMHGTCIFPVCNMHTCRLARRPTHTIQVEI